MDMPIKINARIIYLLTLIIVIILGLASRIYGQSLPRFVAENAGDMLWAMMVYFGFRFLFVRRGIPFAAFLSFLFSFGIEFSQLYQAEWINQVRSTVIGALVLGHGFLVVDLFRYSAGIFIAAFLDYLIMNSPSIRKY
jgi:glycopeptide antibiotics resistance protein